MRPTEIFALVVMVTALAPARAEVTCAEPASGPVAIRQDVRVLLLDFDAPAERVRLARALGQVVAGEAARVPGLLVLSADEVRAALDTEAEKQLAGCDDNSCLSELAAALDADLVVTGRLEPGAEGGALFSLALLNTRAMVTMNRVNMRWPGAEDRLPDVARAAAQLLVFEPAMRPPGALEFQSLPEDAAVFVDEVDVTSRIREGGLNDLEVGPHEVRLSAPGYLSRVENILIQSGETTRVDGSMEPESSLMAWLMWSGGAVAVVGIGAIASAWAVVALTTPSSVDASATMRIPSLAQVEATNK